MDKKLILIAIFLSFVRFAILGAGNDHVALALAAAFAEKQYEAIVPDPNTYTLDREEENGEAAYYFAEVEPEPLKIHGDDRRYAALTKQKQRRHRKKGRNRREW
jgi:hypothetical protein